MMSTTATGTSLLSGQKSDYQICQVCGSWTLDHIQNGSAVCTACKKFYTRTKKQISDMVCMRGNDSCLQQPSISYLGDDSSGSEATTVANNGALWRSMCSRCRLLRCISLGMGRNSSTSSANKPESHKRKFRHVLAANPANSEVLSEMSNTTNNNETYSIHDISLHSSQSGIFESLLRRTVSASEILVRKTASLPMVSSFNGVISERDFWHLGMLQFNQALGNALEFASNVFASLNLPEQLQNLLVFKALVPITIAKTARCSPQPIAMNTSNEKMCQVYLPELKASQDGARQMCQLLANWNPSHAEFSILLASLLLQGLNGITGLDPRWYHALSNLANLLETGLRTIVQQTNCGIYNDETALNCRVSYFRYVSAKLLETSSQRWAALQSFANRCPNLVEPYHLWLEALRCNYSGSASNY